jgi:hypothetical protein
VGAQRDRKRDGITQERAAVGRVRRTFTLRG